MIASAAAPLIAQRRNAAAPRPNIVLIMTDDLAAWMLGCYGNKEIKTPNIDALAQSGTRFLNHSVCTPICSPSRATFFTGRTPRQHGIHDFLTDNPVADPPQGQKDVPASFANEVMISDVLSGIGYNCGYVGKWHMGDSRKLGHGITFSYTQSNLASGYDGSPMYQDPVMWRNGERIQEKGYLAEILTKGACEYLDKQSASQPFFLTVSYNNPHTPYTGHPQRYYDMYAGKKFETFGYSQPAPNALREKNFLNDIPGNIAKCAAAVTALDDQIPALRKKIHERGLADNTLIIFTGDNGFLLGRHGLWSKGYASNPINMYEEVVQVPMLWSWPGKVPPEIVRPELISSYDLMPTICDIVDAPVPSRNLCGRSYLALATGQPLPRRTRWQDLVFSHFRNTEMARDSRYKLVVRNEGAGPNELYDLRADPRERTNQFENPEFNTVRERLTKELEAWRKKYA